MVFNPLPWRRDCVVRVKLLDEWYGPEMSVKTLLNLQDLATGKTVPAEVMECPWVEFVARDVPPFGYRTYVPVDKAVVPPKVSTQDENVWKTSISVYSWIRLRHRDVIG